MDGHTLTVLDFPKVREILANFTQTEIGRESALKIEPITDTIWVKNELNRLEELMELKEEPNLSMVTDIRPLVNTPNQSLLSPQSLNQIRFSLAGMRQVREFFNKRKERLALITQITHQLKTFEPIEQAIDKTIDVTNAIKDDASPELKRIRTALRTLRNEIIKRLEKIVAANTDLFQDQGITLKGERFVLPLKLEAKGKIPGILHDYSASGKTLFVEPLELVDTQNEMAQLMSSETEESKRILANLTAMVNQNRSAILSSLQAIAELDLLFAKKRWAVRFDCVKPEITNDGHLQIINGRHPLLVWKKNDVVPLNLTLLDDTRTVLISGPNAGGKTVVLKTVGIFGLMLAAGMYLPAQYVAMPVYQNIFADIGDEQSLETDLSSFSAHLLRVKQILAEAKQKSLVLLDEIGSSTAPEEGSALAFAILEALRDQDAVTLATSHFGQLKLLVHNTKGMVNAAMEFCGKPTYRLIMGVPGESSALAISQELGLPLPLLERAKEYLGKDWLDLSEKIKNLNEELAKTASLNRALQISQTELEKLKNEYENKVSQFRAFEAEEKRKIRHELNTLLKTTRKEIENLVRAIREKNGEKSTIVQAKKYIASKLETIAEPPSVKKESASDLKPGDYVFSHTFRKQGLVVETKTKDTITVAFGSIKVKLPAGDLEKIKANQSQPMAVFDSYEFNPKLTIRGLTAAEAEAALNKFLDDALIAGVKNLTILHGKGKAVLKQLVWKKLRRDPRVETIRLAEPYEGGDGVTLVRLK